jgi:hypothetical protein
VGGFIEKFGMVHYSSYYERAEKTVYYIDSDLILDDTGKLAIAARDFLKGQKNEPTP